MSAILMAILGAATKVGAGVVKNIIQKKIGSNAGDAVVDEVVERVSKKLGVPPEAIPHTSEAELNQAVAQVEKETPEILDKYIRMQELSVEVQKAEMDKAESWWEWAWRPFWMWLLAFLWTWTIFLGPLITAVTGMQFVVFVNELTALTVTYTAFYMGGHTAKRIWNR